MRSAAEKRKAAAVSARLQELLEASAGMHAPQDATPEIDTQAAVQEAAAAQGMTVVKAKTAWPKKV